MTSESVLAMMSATQRRAGQIVGMVLTVAVATWLGYAFGRGQSLADVARLYRDQDSMHYTIDTGQLIADFARTGGDLKPLLRAPDGTPLMSYSDWDYAATVVADGQRFEFVRLVPSDSVDYARNRIASGLSSGDWVLSREITLTGPSAEVRYTFLANRPLKEVRITVAHTNWYFLDVNLTDDGFQGTVARASRSEIETGLIRSPSYAVVLNAIPAGEPVPQFARVGLATRFGVQSVTTQYVLREPEVGQYVAVAREVLSLRKL